jgi:hypothetical protein
MKASMTDVQMMSWPVGPSFETLCGQEEAEAEEAAAVPS